jgi:hypothetical protein
MTQATSIHDLPYEVTPTNLPGAYASVAPLDDFDPRTASAAELRRGILLRRPGLDDAPAQRAAWDTVFSRVWRAQDRIVPHLEPQVGRTHRPSGTRHLDDGSYTSSNWAGASIAGTWTTAIGFWVVPGVTEPREPQGGEGGWNSSSWVGLDGAYSSGPNASDDVLQAGVEQRVGSNGTASYVAWYEWFAPATPDSPGYIYQTNISGFPVSPGDTVYCAVGYAERTLPIFDAGTDGGQRDGEGLIPITFRVGTVYFANDTTGQHFTITLDPPPGATASGGSAEWIMEAPDGGEPTASLPRFSPVTFTSAICCGAASSGDPVNGDIWNIVGDGTTLTSVTTADYTVTIDYAGH